MTSTQFTGSGTDDRLRAELETMADTLAAKTAMPFVIPVKEILAVVYKVFSDVPRVPNYDDTLSRDEQPSFSNAVMFSLVALPDTPKRARAYVDKETGLIRLMIEDDEVCEEIELEPGVARGLFLAGLAAVAHAEQPAITD